MWPANVLITAGQRYVVPRPVTRRAIQPPSQGTSPAAVLDAIGDAYAHLIADRDLLMVQLHAQCAAASEPAIQAAVRAGYARLTEYARSVSGADEAELQRLFATGALCQLVVSIGAEQVDAPWARTLSNGIRHY